MRRRDKKEILFAILPALFIIFSFSRICSAIEPDITAKTYMRFYEDSQDNKFQTFYEYLELDVRDIKEGALNFYSAGWLRYDFRSVTFQKREQDELTYAYLRYYPLKDRRLLFDAGRHYVFDGGYVIQLDGLSMKWDILPKTGLSIFGGSPVENEFDGRRGDSVYGGRIYQKIGERAEVGASFLRENDDEARYREEFGVDFWALPIRQIEVQGRSGYNNITDGWMDHSYKLRLFPIEKLTLSGLFSHTSYDNAFSATTLSAFSPDFLDPDEEVTKKGGSIEYRLNKTFRITTDFVNYDYEKAGEANYYGGAVAGNLFGIAAGFSVHRMAGDTEELRYTETRLYASKIMEKVKVSVDAIDHYYDDTFNGLRNAYAVNGTLRYALKDYLTAAASLDYIKSPDFSHNTRILLSLGYNFRKKI